MPEQPPHAVPARPAHRPAPRGRKSERGLAYWMRRVLVECDRAERQMSVAAVHDLRVALRRCRSVARCLMEIDPDPEWRAMRKAGKRLFRSFGELRDVQVMREWVRTLAAADDPVRRKMARRLAAHERALRAEARARLAGFDRTAWRRWMRLLPARAGRVPSPAQVFRHVALERCREGRALHRLALRDRTRTAYHRLRVGLKRFRYTVENFLPELAAEWDAELKALQDRLGEVHDLDVLWTALPSAAHFVDPGARDCWRERLDGERGRRIDEYRAVMLGRRSLWRAWLSRLGTGEATGLAKLGAWASFRDPDFAETRRIAACALEVFDQLGTAGVGAAFTDARARRLLHAAALVHRVGRVDGKRGHHKTSHRLILGQPVPVGWTPEDLGILALAVRYHRGGPPRPHHAELRTVEVHVRNVGLELAGTLRLAIAIARGGQRPALDVRIKSAPEGIVLETDADDECVAEILRSKWLLELACRRTVIVRRLASRCDRRWRGERDERVKRRGGERSAQGAR